MGSPACEATLCACKGLSVVCVCVCVCVIGIGMLGEGVRVSGRSDLLIYKHSQFDVVHTLSHALLLYLVLLCAPKRLCAEIHCC